MVDGCGEITSDDCIGAVTEFNLPLPFYDFADDFSASMAVHSTWIRLPSYFMNLIVQKMEDCKLRLCMTWNYQINKVSYTKTMMLTIIIVRLINVILDIDTYLQYHISHHNKPHVVPIFHSL